MMVVASWGIVVVWFLVLIARTEFGAEPEVSGSVASIANPRIFLVPWLSSGGS